MSRLPHGKVAYLEIPAIEVARSADFYAKVFGWRIRERRSGRLAFDDTAGELSGTWVTGRPAAAVPGLLIYIHVEDVAAIVETARAYGGQVVQPIGADAPEVTARLADPAGNVIGVFQEPARVAG